MENQLRLSHLRIGIITGIVFFLTGCIPQSQNTGNTSPFKSDGAKELVAEKAMVSSAHPLASEAGLEMIRKGGNAVDAAVATAFALNVVEPEMSGIGGGGSMLIWNQKEKEADYVDFYTAVRAETYKEVDYSKYKPGEFSMLSTGIPGTVKGLLQVLEKYGTLTRQEVMAPAIRYATEGYPMYLTLAEFILSSEEKLSRYKGARDLFWPDGEPVSVGEIFKQPELAKTLQSISDNGEAAFYEGKNAEDMVKLYNEGGNPITLKDLADFEPVWDKVPLCSTYNGYTVLSAPVPQTGFYIIEALNILEKYDLKSMGLPTNSARAFHLLASAMRLGNADQMEYVFDPDWRDIPLAGLVSKEYADTRRALIDENSVPDKVEFGVPNTSSALLPACETLNLGTGNKAAYNIDMEPGDYDTGKTWFASASDEDWEQGETTHISVIDTEGNAVSFSTTLSSVFGSGAFVNGFLLNDSAFRFTNFSEDSDWESTNPYMIRSSTILPTIILKDNDVRLVIGAPGGGRIPTAVLQNIVYILDYGLDPLDAVKMPRLFPSSANNKVQIERGFNHDELAKLREIGYDIQTLSFGYARIYLVYKKDGKLIGVSDPRHDGEPRGF